MQSRRGWNDQHLAAMIWVQATTHSSEVFSMDPITFTVTPRGSDQAITIDLSALLTQLQTVPDQRKRRGVRYPLAVLFAIAVLAKLCGDSQVHALADWAHARAAALAAVFGLPRPTMPHPTTWTRVLGNAVAAAAIETALQPLLEPPPTQRCRARQSYPRKRCEKIARLKRCS